MNHAADFLRTFNQPGCFVFGNDLDAAPKLELRFKFRSGRVCHPEVPDVQGRVMTRMSFGDIRRNGHRRLSNLIAKNHLVLHGKSSRQRVAALGKIHALFPDEEIATRFDVSHA